MSTDDGLIRFACPCGKSLKAPAPAAGRNASCPKCGRAVAIPPSTPPEPKPEPKPDPAPPPAAEDVVWQLGMTAPGEPEPVFDPDAPVAPAPHPDRPRATPVDEYPRRRRRRALPPAGDAFGIVPVYVLTGGFGAAVGGLVGYLMSQYMPVFGDFLSIQFAQPWSPARAAYIPHHVLAGVLLGCVPGPALAFLSARR